MIPSVRLDRSSRAQANLRQVRLRRQAMKLRGARLRPRRIPRIQQPDAIRAQYYSMLRGILAVAKALVERRVVPLLPNLLEQAKAERGDARGLSRTDASRINNLLDGISEKFYRQLSPDLLDLEVGKVARATSENHRRQFQRQAKAALGIDLQMAEPGLAGRISQFTAENVALIKSLPQQYFDQVEKIVTAGVSDGDRAEDIAQEISDRFGVAESRAELIANDQIGKFFGDLQQARQEAVGVEEYIWRTMRDERVRDDHQEREGEKFRWDDPPEDGAPGEAVNCRCFAEPVFDQILEDL